MSQTYTVTCNTFFSTHPTCHRAKTMTVSELTGEEKPEELLPVGWGVYTTGNNVQKIACPQCLYQIRLASVKG